MERVSTGHVLSWAPCQVWEAKRLGVIKFEGVDLFMGVDEHCGVQEIVMSIHLITITKQ
jgi:hypothetical protein